MDLEQLFEDITPEELEPRLELQILADPLTPHSIWMLSRSPVPRGFSAIVCSLSISLPICAA